MNAVKYHWIIQESSQWTFLYIIKYAYHPCHGSTVHLPLSNVCWWIPPTQSSIFSVYPGRTWVGWKSVSSMLASMFLIIFTFLMFSTHLRVKEFAGSCTRKEVIELSQPALCFHWETQFQICARSSSTWFFTCIRSLINQVNFVVQ